MAEAEKDDWLDDLDSPEEKPAALDQSDLDTLTFDSNGQGQQAPPPAPSVETELDQSAIDAMLSGTDDIFSSPQSESPAAETFDLGQSDINDLLASLEKPAQNQEGDDPDQDEIDKLFADIGTDGDADEGNPFLAEDSLDDSDTFANLPFNTEEGNRDTLTPKISATQSSQDFDLPHSFMEEEEHVAALAIDEPSTRQASLAPDITASQNNDLGRQGLAAKIAKLFGNRKRLLAIGGSVAMLLLILAGVLLMRGRQKTPSIESSTAKVASNQPPGDLTAAKQHEPAADQAVPPQPAEPPVKEPEKQLKPHITVDDLEFSMPPETSQLVITLAGKDPENDPLDYQFQSMPEHGQLSAHAPNLIYTPKPNYSGQEGFTDRASDGKNISPPASIKITRQAPAAVNEQPVVVEAKKIEPPVELVKAEATIEGKRETKENSKEPPKSILTKTKANRPAAKSKPVAANTQHHKRAPVIQLQQLAPSYTSGDTVVLNASQTSDANRESLTFEWEQLSGIQVLLKPVSSDKSQIAFMAPSNFNTVTNPTVVIKVTARNREGASDSKEIIISTKSRRNSAIWQGRQ